MNFLPTISDICLSDAIVSYVKLVFSSFLLDAFSILSKILFN